MSTKGLTKQKSFYLFLKDSTELGKQSWSGKLFKSFSATG